MNYYSDKFDDHLKGKNDKKYICEKLLKEFLKNNKEI